MTFSVSANVNGNGRKGFEERTVREYMDGVFLILYLLTMDYSLLHFGFFFFGQKPTVARKMRKRKDEVRLEAGSRGKTDKKI